MTVEAEPPTGVQAGRPPEAAAPRPKPRRRWIRRMTYLLAAGTALVAVAAWTVRRPFVTAWVLRELGQVVRSETGLELAAEDLEISLLAGRLVLHRVRWGGDLLQVRRVELAADLWSLGGSRPRIHALHLEEPRLRLDRARLAAIRLRPRPPAAEPVKLLLGRFSVRDGLVDVQEPAWGVPAGRVGFLANATGLGPNHLSLSLLADRLELGREAAGLRGAVRLEAECSEAALQVKMGEVTLGRSRLSASGRTDLKAGRLDGTASVHLDLAELGPHAGRSGLAGTADLTARFSGTTAEPGVELELTGRELADRALPLQPASLRLSARGRGRQIQVPRFEWESREGRLRGEGEWRSGGGLRARITGEALDLGPAADLSKVAFLRELRASLDATVQLAEPVAFPPRLDRAAVSASVAFQRHDQPAGRAVLALTDGQLDCPELEFRVPEFELGGTGRARLGSRGLESIQGSGRLRTDAAEVAKVLRAWQLAELPMAGRTEARASVSWDPAQGLRLDGEGEVVAPRWQRAQADRIRSAVRIRGSQLWVDGTELVKGDGRGWGELWLDWGKVAPGASTFDLCYRGFRLPVAVGLAAADDGKNELSTLPISGLGSAWVRIHGDWEHLRLTGEGVLENGRAYGLRLPAGRASIDYDLFGNRLRIPEFRLAESTGQLGEPGAEPEGFLALRGSLEMDLARERWSGRVAGNLDSVLLELPGPRFQAAVQGELEGPWISRFGGLDLPSGWARFTQGRLFIGDQSIEGLRGSVRHREGELAGELGSLGHEQPILAIRGQALGDTARGTAELRVAADTSDTRSLAARLTGDLLRDAAAELRAEWSLDSKGLDWSGQLRHFAGFFQGFTLAQERPGTLTGNAAEARLDLALAGTGPAGSARGTPSARLQLAGKVPFDPAAPVDLGLKGTGELSNLKTILDHLLDLENAPGLLADLQPEGRASVDLRANGPLNDPRVDGTLDLVDGRLRLRNYAQSIEDVIFTLRFKGRDIILTEEDPLIGTLAQGALGLWGRATWGLGGLQSYDFSARLEEFLLRDLPQGFELQGQLEANLTGTDQAGGIVRGTLQAERAAYRTDISLGDLLLGGFLTATPELSGLDPDDPLARIDLDLDLLLAQPWDFDTNLLKIKGRPEGSFKVLGTLARPGLKGRMEFLPGGRLTNLLPAGDIVLERGSIAFVDPTTVNPLINLEGRIDIPPYLVTLSINGTLDQLNFVPTSTPSLRQDEIVAILIDPAAAPSIGTSTAPTSQSALNYGLASASSGLLATLAFANFGETLRKTLNLDRVNPVVRTGTTGTLESSLTIGKTFDLFGSRTPIIGTYTRSGNLVTLSGQVEWRFGNFVLQLGVSSSAESGTNPTGEIRHTWSLR